MANADITYIDPMFYIPEGIDPRVWTRDPNAVPSEDDGITESSEGDSTEVAADVTIVDTGTDSSNDAIPTPENLTILGQSLRRASDGSIVVDIVVNVDDVYGATKYEFRVTKI